MKRQDAGKCEARSVMDDDVARGRTDVEDAKLPVPASAAQSRRTKPSLKVKLAFAILLSLLLAYGLLVRFQARTWQPRYDTSGIASTNELSAKDDVYLLHPDQHIYRQPTTFRQHWRVTTGLRRPDGVLKQVYLINGAFPGPLIEARSSDRIVVEVENALEHGEGVAIHWHGLSMRNANAMDGAVGLTQEAVQPGETFTYNFTIEEAQHGTFWYHGHAGVQRADGLYGGLVVHEPSDKADEDVPSLEERLLLVGDWFHRASADTLAWYMSAASFGMEPVPDSLLVNGAGAFNCSKAVPARPLDCLAKSQLDLPSLIINRGKPLVLRVVNVGSYAGLTLGIRGATLTPLASDGGNGIAASAVEAVGVLSPGERVLLLVKAAAKQAGPTSSLTISIDSKPFKYENAALTESQHFPVLWHGTKPTKSSGTTKDGIYDLSTAEPSRDQRPLMSKTVDQTIVLYAITEKLAQLNNVPHGFINHTTWKPQADGPLINIPRSRWDRHQLVPHIPFDRSHPRWVDIIINNLDEDDHPFHLHGYSFWVLGKYSSDYNWGSFNPFEDSEPPGGPLELSKAVKKDTVRIPRRGYAVLRFKADNPGIWALHCHVSVHHASGMALAIQVGESALL